MADTVGDRLDRVHPQMLRAESESARKVLAVDHRARVGQLVARALALAALTPKAAAITMGYRDQGVVSRWCSGIERPLFDKLFAIDGFEAAWLLALAEGHPGIEVETVVRIPRRRIA